jgi:hypothetical protein
MFLEACRMAVRRHRLEEPELPTPLIAIISNAELDRLIAELGRHPLTKGELRKVEGTTGVYVSLSIPAGKL